MNYQEDCLFCKIAQHQIPAKIRFENEEIIAFDDIKPNAPTHILIIPKRHIESVASLTSEDEELIGKLILKARDLANEAELTNGYRLTTNTGPDSGQAVHHLHFHLIGGKKLGPIG